MPSEVVSRLDTEREKRLEELRQKYTFLLGGADLEMVEIKHILDENNMPYVDNNLSWGAKIDDYGEQIPEIENAGKDIVAIELGGAQSIDGVIDMNHHGERSHEQSPLIQILGLLELEPTRQQLLIAANDSGYIPALQELGATDREIAEIRLLDRRSQGITEEQEGQAEQAIKNKEIEGRLTTVIIPHNKTAAVTDRLFGQYDQLLIFNEEGGSNYFGDGQICANLLDEFQGWAGGSGLGVEGGNAYWGGYVPRNDVLEIVRQEIENLDKNGRGVNE